MTVQVDGNGNATVQASAATNGRPRYNVVGGDKPVSGVTTWAAAADHASRYGGKVRAVRT